MENHSVINLPSTHLGLIRFKLAWDIQERIRQEVLEGNSLGEVLFTQHPPTLSLGRAEKGNNLLFQNEELIRLGFEVVETNRGGKVTYHGPGQLVVYPIIDLSSFKMGVKQYVHALEETMLSLLKKLNLPGERKDGCPGAWVRGKKIGSIGIHVRKQVSIHGLAFNVEPQMDHFNVITPCGLEGVTMTSTQKEGCTKSFEEVLSLYTKTFEEVFRCKLQSSTFKEMRKTSGIL